MMLAKLRTLLEMVRFSHTLFALPFALLASILAWRAPAAMGASPQIAAQTIGFRWIELVGILLCMVFARSAAMSFNRLADRDIDAGNPRTASRHLVTGELSTTSVWVFTLANCVGFVLSTLVFLPNRWPILLSVPVLAVLFAYSYTKRVTALAHFWLGASLMLAPICAWIAIRGELVAAAPADLIPAVMVGIAVLAWVAGFDIIYACQDAKFDREAKLQSVPAKLGVSRALKVAAVCHAFMIFVLAVFPFVCPQLGLDWVYAAGIGVVALLLIYEHSIVRPDDLQQVNIAFFNVNVIVSIGLMVIVIIDLLT
jgi:4-hydroxybenzoate polyprenyltransferase